MDDFSFQYFHFTASHFLCIMARVKEYNDDNNKHYKISFSYKIFFRPFRFKFIWKIELIGQSRVCPFV